jgi:hypothetical protein
MTKLEWARDVVARRCVLFSPRTFVIGIAERLWDGTDDPFTDTSGLLIPHPVIHLSTGHDLLANPEAFVELRAHEADFFAVATNRLHDFLVGGMGTARQMSIPEPTALLLIVATLRAQLVALEATAASTKT